MCVPCILNSPSHLPLYPAPLGCHRALALGALCHTANVHWLSILHMVMYMFQCCSLRSSHPLLLLLSPKVCSLHLCLLCCSACRRVSTTFLDSIYIHYYTVFFFLFLTYFPLYDRLQIYPPHLELTMSHLLNMHC